jgi:hypothetical protein
MKSASIELSPDAINDIGKAIDYYNNLSQGLGYEFLNTIDRYFKRIQELPSASSIRYDNVRVKPIDTFPFTIHYTINEFQIIILRIFNTYQNIG